VCQLRFEFPYRIDRSQVVEEEVEGQLLTEPRQN